jgi:hypothetical protein
MRRPRGGGRARRRCHLHFQARDSTPKEAARAACSPPAGRMPGRGPPLGPLLHPMGHRAGLPTLPPDGSAWFRVFCFVLLCFITITFLKL